MHKFETSDPTARRKIDRSIGLELKVGCALTTRAAEYADKIRYDTAERLAFLESQLEEAAWRMAIVRYFTIGTSGILATIVSTWILAQTMRLLRRRRLSEADLRRSRATLETILESIPVGVAVVGADHRVRKMNASALKTAGYTTDEEVVGKFCHETLCPKRMGQCPILDLGQSVDHSECILISKTGKRIPILKTVTPIEIDDETVLLEAFFDITEQKRAEEKLEKYHKHLEQLVEERTAGLAQTNQRLEEEIHSHQKTEIELKHSADALKAAVDEMAKLKDAAEAASQAKSEFLANMSHEIRTPMTSILGFADLLQSPDTEEGERRSYIDTIRRSGRALLDLINDILDLSKVEAGRMVADIQECSFLDILQDAVSLLQPVAEQKCLTLEVRYDFPLPAKIQSDPGRLRQIIVNLVGNAIKFTSSGHVRLFTKMVHLADGSTRIQFDVEDTGIGLPEKAIRHIFEPFTQVDSSASRRYGGTGLGLAVSRKLARLLGGDITARSKQGKGSTFKLTIDPGSLDDVLWLDALPKGRQTSHRDAPKDSWRQWQGRVLLAEDGPDNQRLISTILKKLGLQVEIAENGAVAYREAMRSARENLPYDLILMDMQMPEMDGYEATRKLRQTGWKSPIIALTAHAMSNDRDKCLEAGCDEYLTKPIDRDRLSAVIDNYLQPKIPAKSNANTDL
ncbi:MAG: response regulator [Pirellulales bacterium]|nr:response regulator [Pirellulales bacterium]